jgi:L-amino acid N-acyltransferase YncA
VRPVIRSALVGDSARCAEIYHPYVADSWVSFERDPPDATEMARRIAGYGKSHGWLVAEIDGRVAGYAYGCPHRTREAYQTSADVAVYVDSAYSRTGIGKALYTALFPILTKCGVHAIFAGIALPNDASIGLHEAMGFTPVGIYREVGWKMDGWRDVGWWQRLL